MRVRHQIPLVTQHSEQDMSNASCLLQLAYASPVIQLVKQIISLIPLTFPEHSLSTFILI